MKAEQSSDEMPDLEAWPSAAISAWMSLKFGLKRALLVETLRMRSSMFDAISVELFSWESEAFRTKIQAMDPATTRRVGRRVNAQFKLILLTDCGDYLASAATTLSREGSNPGSFRLPTEIRLASIHRFETV